MTGPMADPSAPDDLPACNTAVLALGGNLGDVPASFSDAIAALAERPDCAVMAASSVWRTRPWGVADQPGFLNMAVLVRTRLAPRQLLDLCLDLERGAGRVRATRWGPRSLDIDIIAFDALRMEEPDLTIPHPRAHERMFVLVPVCEIAPDVRLGRARAESLLQAMRDALPEDAPDRDMAKDEAATARIATLLRSFGA